MNVVRKNWGEKVKQQFLTFQNYMHKKETIRIMTSDK